jgi:DNA mismatch endonuclease (patch repair protein)
MAAIRSRGNASTERRFRAFLVRHGISGWRLHANEILGCPDFFFSEVGLAMFLDGCFWHGCPKCGHIPRQNTVYWATKIEKNRLRDRHVTAALRHKGIKVMRVWEHDIKRNPQKVISHLNELIG